MKQMSFSLTTPQFRARTKHVTRRNGWMDAKVGDRVMAVEKGMGLKKGEKVVYLGMIEFTQVRREPLNAMTSRRLSWCYGALECGREGFPNLTPRQFVRMYCKHNGCSPRKVVTRIEFTYIDETKGKV